MTRNPLCATALARTLSLMVLLALLGALVCPPNSLAREEKQKISPVCATADFFAFLEAYVLAPKEEQMSCIRFSDFVYRGNKISSPAQLVKSEAARSKLLFSRQDVNAEGKADPRFFYKLPVDMFNNGPAFNHTCYMIRAEGAKRHVSLTVGGTFPLETVVFDWDGNNWRVIEVIQEESQ